MGKTIAKQIFDQYRGRWRVQQKERNYPAQAFWRSVIKEYTNNTYIERYDEHREPIQEFINESDPLVLQVNEDLLLKRLEPSDARPLFTLVDQDRDYLRRWLPWVDYNQSVKNTEEFIQENTNQYFRNRSFQTGIWFEGNLAGCIGFHHINWPNRSTSIGYWLGEDFQGHGVRHPVHVL